MIKEDIENKIRNNCFEIAYQEFRIVESHVK